MDLLPKSSADFSSSEYWETFFKKRGSKAFEWYGEYPQLCGVLHKYIRATDRVLVIGCGNSRLSEDLYDVGYHQLINIDIVESVVKQMSMRNAKRRPDMKFEQMDVMQMTYDDSSYSVVLDKGTLDALMPNDSEEVQKQVTTMFAEIARVLKVGGRYVCITLAQEHIIQKLLDFFPNEGWMVRVHKIDKSKKEDASDKESPMPVFVVICTKFKKMGAAQTPILEVSMSEKRNPQRVPTVEDVQKAVKEQQDYAMVQQGLRNRSYCDENLSLDLYAADNSAPRYTLHIVDKPKGNTETNKFAIFIVPQGRETEFLFGTVWGRGQLANQVGYKRLVVVTLHRGHTYESIDSIKAELSSKVMELSPGDLPDHTQVPFLSMGNDVGQRDVRYQGVGSLGNDVIVEDVRGEDNHTYRQLIFANNPYLVQSQARLMTETPRSKSGKRRGKPGKPVTRIDHLHLAMAFHQSMVAGLAVIPRCVEMLQSKARVLLIGLGGGGLAMFLHQQFPKLELDVVELDGTMKDVASHWFGLVEDDRLKLHIQDGLEFIKTQTEKKTISTYNAVMFDVDNKDFTLGLSCPPRAFLQPCVLQQVKKLLHPTQGVFILNFACRDERLKETLLDEIREHFPTVYISRPLEDDINEIVYCLPERTCVEAERQRALLKDSGRALQKLARSVTSRWDSSFDLCSIMEDLKLGD